MERTSVVWDNSSDDEDTSWADTTMPLRVRLMYTVEIELDGNRDLHLVHQHVEAPDKDAAARAASQASRAYLHSPHYVSHWHVTEEDPVVEVPPRKGDQAAGGEAA
jgi:hypothetical protein